MRLAGPPGGDLCGGTTWIPFRHLDLYDRFGCPSSHIQAAFRCLVRQGHIDPKAQESLNGRVHACWLNPALTPAEAVQPPAAPSGTTSR